MCSLYDLCEYVLLPAANPDIEWVYRIFDEADRCRIGYPVFPGGGGVLAEGDGFCCKPSVTDADGPFLRGGIKTVLGESKVTEGDQKYKCKKMPGHRETFKQKGSMVCMEPVK